MTNHDDEIHVMALKGGSLSSTSVMTRNRKIFVRKTVDAKRNREYGFVRWSSQLRRLLELTADQSDLFPKVLEYGVDSAGVAYFDIEYVEGSSTVYDYVSSLADGRSSSFVADRVYDELRRVHGAPKDAPNDLELYFSEEVVEALNAACRISSSFRDFADQPIVELNGVRSPRLKDLLGAFGDMVCGSLDLPGWSKLHGNPTLENTLYIADSDRIVFIDPYEESTTHSNLLDFAQVLQSAELRYEDYCRSSVTIDRYSIQAETPRNDALTQFANRFWERILTDFPTSEVLVRWFLCSQFVRMLPFKVEADLDHACLFYAIACQNISLLLRNSTT